MMGVHTMTEKEMIQKIKKREEEGLACLIEAYGKYVASIIYGVSGCRKEDAEEMAADVFVSFWNHAEGFDENRSVKPWLREMARNIAIDRYRKDAKKEGSIPLELLGEFPTKQDDLEEHLQKEMLEQAVLELKESDRRIFLAFYYENKKIKEIAEEFSLSQGAIKTKLHRSRKQIQKALLKGGLKR